MGNQRCPLFMQRRCQTTTGEVELRDTGYPGSTYTLLYDPDKDALLGLYYQAVQRRNFEVVFVPMK